MESNWRWNVWESGNSLRGWLLFARLLFRPDLALVEYFDGTVNRRMLATPRRDTGVWIEAVGVPSDKPYPHPYVGFVEPDN